jgi:hypothetical protein
MTCSGVRENLGAYLDGELPAAGMEAVRLHLAECVGCRAAYEELQSAVGLLEPRAEVHAPPNLWEAIESGLDGRAGARPHPGAGDVRIWRRTFRPLLIAAAVLLPLGVVWLVVEALSPRPAQADEAVIDFRPLLNGIGSDFDGAMSEFLKNHQARQIPFAEAGRYVHVRLHPKSPLPDGFVLARTDLLTLGKRHGLLLQFAGPKGRLVISQCPVGVKEEHGERSCLPCRLAATEGKAVRVGAWSLVHLPSQKGCICVISTLDRESDLAEFLSGLEIEF